MAIALSKPFELVRASRYANAGTAAEILPEVYGDFRTGGLAGPLPAVLIDTTANVYAVAAHPVDDVTAVYVGPTLQTEGVDYTKALSDDYESQGGIATLTFATAPTDTVTWRGLGKVVDGSVATNAITQLYDLLTTRGGFTDADLHLGALKIAEARVTAGGIRTAWAVRDERDTAEWIQEILFNVFGRWYLSSSTNRLVFAVDTGDAPSEHDLVAHVVAQRDCVDGEDGVEMVGDHDALVNALTVHYLWNWALESASSRIVTLQDARSRHAHGEVRKAVTLKGVRESADLTTWAAILFKRQAFAQRTEGARLSFAVVGGRLAHATIGDYLGLSWDLGPTREHGTPYRNQIVQIASISIDPMRGGETTVTTLDTGAFLTGGAQEVFDADNDFTAAAFWGGSRLLTRLH